MINNLTKLNPTNLCTTAEQFQCLYTPGMHLKQGTTDQYAIHEDLSPIAYGGTLTGVQTSQVAPELSCYNLMGKTFSIVSLPNNKGGFLIPHKPGQYVKTFYVPQIGAIQYDGSDADHPLLDLGGMVTVKRLGVVLLDDGAIGANDQIIQFRTKNGVSRIGFWGTGGNIAIHTADEGKVGLFKEFACSYMSDKLRVANAAAKANNKAACLIYAVFEPDDTIEVSVRTRTSQTNGNVEQTQIDGTIQSLNVRFFAHDKITGNGKFRLYRGAIPNANDVAGNVAVNIAPIADEITYVNLGAIGTAGECHGIPITGNADFHGNMLEVSLTADTTDTMFEFTVTAKVVAS